MSALERPPPGMENEKASAAIARAPKLKREDGARAEHELGDAKHYKMQVDGRWSLSQSNAAGVENGGCHEKFLKGGT